MSSKVATGASVPGVVNTTNAYCIALHQYPSSKPDELALVPGDVIQVMKKADDGWWYGESKVREVLAYSDRSKDPTCGGQARLVPE